MYGSLEIVFPIEFPRNPYGNQSRRSRILQQPRNPREYILDILRVVDPYHPRSCATIVAAYGHCLVMLFGVILTGGAISLSKSSSRASVV
jgi:hypothetical protein